MMACYQCANRIWIIFRFAWEYPVCHGDGVFFLVRGVRNDVRPVQAYVCTNLPTSLRMGVHLCLRLRFWKWTRIFIRISVFAYIWSFPATSSCAVQPSLHVQSVVCTAFPSPLVHPSFARLLAALLIHPGDVRPHVRPCLRFYVLPPLTPPPVFDKSLAGSCWVLTYKWIQVIGVNARYVFFKYYFQDILNVCYGSNIYSSLTRNNSSYYKMTFGFLFWISIFVFVCFAAL